VRRARAGARMKLPAFEYACPATLDEAVALLAKGGGEARILAGGQSLVPFMAFRLAAPELLVDLRRIPGLRGIEIGPEEMRLGSMLRWRDILDSDEIAAALPILPDAVRHVAHYQIRNRGTLGGSLAHADPAAEFGCIALLCGAEIEAVGTDGTQRIPAGELIVGPMETALAEDEIITAVRFPAWPGGRRWAFKEFASRDGDFAIAAVALFFDMDGPLIANAHVAVMGATETARRVAEAEAALNGQSPDEATFARAAAALSAAIEPTEDTHADADYRRSLAGTLLQRGLQTAVSRKRGTDG